MNGLWLTEWLAEGPRISPIWYYEAVPSAVVKCFEHDTHLCLFNSSTQELNWIFLQLNEVFLFVSPSDLCQSSVQRRRRRFILSRGIGWHNLWPTKESASLDNNSIGHRLTSNLIIDRKEAIPNWIRMRVLVTELRKNLFFAELVEGPICGNKPGSPSPIFQRSRLFKGKMSQSSHNSRIQLNSE